MRSISNWAVLACSVGVALAAGPAWSQTAPTAGPSSQEQLETITITGSRIPRPKLDEGPSPIIVITAQDIKNGGFADVPDVMRALTANLGSLDNNQQTNGFSPGAQAVDLRGMGPITPWCW